MTLEPPPEPRFHSTLERVSDSRSRANTWRDPRAWRAMFGEAALPAYVLVPIFIGVFAMEVFTGGPVDWGLSAEALRDGRWYLIFSHMFAHGSLGHLWMNSVAFGSMTSPLMLRLGPSRRAWPRYVALFILSGLAGAAVFLAINPTGSLPMVGASGAICGLWGALARLGPDGEVLPLRSRQVLMNLRTFAIMNVALFAILYIASAGQGGLAWEAHLGGFLVGLFLAPRLAMPPRRTDVPITPTAPTSPPAP